MQGLNYFEQSNSYKVIEKSINFLNSFKRSAKPSRVKACKDSVPNFSHVTDAKAEP